MKSLVRVLFAITIFAAAPALSHAEGNSHLINVDPASGTAQTQVSIDIPNYHGIEPKVRLSYGSSMQRGFVGVGWQLAATSSVTRSAPRGGAPAYVSTDIYYLDGSELIDCSDLSPPNDPCTTTFGGTHRPKWENYARIKYDSTNDRWIVTQKNGIEAVYTSRITVTISSVTYTYRWDLSTVTDVYGNQVTYNYACPTVPSSLSALSPVAQCYIDTITYMDNGTEDAVKVTFYRTTRNDVSTQAIGGGQLLGNGYFLKSVDVQMKTGGTWRRAKTYELTYGYTSSLSTLQQVKVYGNDATLDSGGSVTSGSSMPAATYTWDNLNLATATERSFGGKNQNSDYQMLGDFNGDGRIDQLYDEYGNGNILVLLGDTNGSGQPVWDTETQWATIGSIHGYAKARWVSEVTGDSKSDYVYLRAYVTGYPNGTIRVLKTNSTGDGFDSEADWGAPANAAGCDGILYYCYIFLTDVNGDGKSDYVYVAGATRQLYVKLANSSGTSFDSSDVYWGTYSYLISNSTRVWFADVNGDGKSDFVYERYGSRELHVMLSKGDSFDTDTLWLTRTYDPEITGTMTQHFIADFNGDGRDDYLYERAGTNEFRVALSTGSSFTTEKIWANRSYGIHQNGLRYPVDVNSDGMVDYVYQKYLSQELRVLISTGISFQTEESWLTQTYQTDHVGGQWPVDMTGDGRIDLVYQRYSYQDFYIQEATGSPQVAVHTASNGRGLTTTVTYAEEQSDGVAYMVSGGSDTQEERDLNLHLMPVIVTQLLSTTDSVTSLTMKTSYDYWDMVFDRDERILLGFSGSTQTISDDGDSDFTDEAYSRTIFNNAPSQRACARQPLEQYTLASDEKIYGYQTSSYATDSTAPYECHPSVQNSYECERETSLNSSGQVVNSALCRHRKTENISYDDYGGPEEVRNYGDFDVSNDETTTVTGYLSTSSSSIYLVGYPKYQKTCEGTGSACASGTILQYSETYYDDGAGQNPPAHDPLTLGEARLQRVWDDNGTTTDLNDDNWIASRTGYDAYGNKISATDPALKIAWTVYDPTYHVFPIRTCNRRSGVTVLGNCDENAADSQQEWDVLDGTTVLGVVTAQIDWSGQRVEKEYDVFGRTIRVKGPEATGSPAALITVGETTYNDSTVPNSVTSKQYEKVGSSSYLETVTYANGWGNPVEKKTKAENSTWISSGRVEYDRLGRVVKAYNPLSTSASSYTGYPPTGTATTINTYDEIGRNIVTEFATEVGQTGFARTYYPNQDGSVTVTLGCMIARNPLGDDRKTCTDGQGRTSYVEEDTSSTTTTRTNYEYDLLGRLKKVTTDANGSSPMSVYVRYNSLGQQLGVYDPNLGVMNGTFDPDDYDTWSAVFAYDNLGRVTQKTDARGSITRFEYDELGRMTLKCATQGGADAVALRKSEGSAPVAANAQGACNSGEIEIARYAYDDYIGTYDAGGDVAYDMPNAARQDNGWGRLIEITDLSGRTAYEYDERGRIAFIRRRMDCDTASSPNQNCVQLDLERSFDLAGRLDTLTFPDGEQVNYSYQERGLLKHVWVGASESSPDREYAKGFVYDAAGNNTRVDLGNGISTFRKFDPASYRMDELATGDTPTALGTRLAPGAILSQTGFSGAVTDIDEDPDTGDANWLTLTDFRAETFAPDAIQSSSNLSGSVTDIDDDPDSPDGLWLTAVSHSTNTQVNLSLPSPTAGFLQEGTDYQEFRIRLRDSNPGDGKGPTYSIRLLEGGTILLNTGNISLSDSDNIVVSFPWNANVLSDLAGDNVEIELRGNKNQSSTVEFGAVEWNLASRPITVAQTLSADAVVEQSNLTGSLADIDDDPDSPDANWMSATSNSSDTRLQVSFPTPSQAFTGAGLQEFRVQVKDSNPGDGNAPKCRLSLYENGSLVSSGSQITITDSSTVVLAYSWNTASLASPSGANVEIRIQGTRTGSSTVSIGAVEWNIRVDIDDPSVAVSFPTPSSVLARGAGLQEFRAQVRQWNTSQSGTPQARIELWENGALVRAGSNTSVPTGGTVLSVLWDADELSAIGGADVEAKVVAVPATGSGGVWNSIEVGAVEWNATLMDATPLQDLSYNYDVAGNILNLYDNRSGAGDQAFTYDTMGRLVTAEETGGYGYRKLSYDNFGNITQKCFNTGCTDYENFGYAAGLPHAVGLVQDEASATVWGGSYDPAGYLYQRTVSGTTYGIQYGADGRVHTIEQNPGPSATTLAQYVLDAHGARVLSYKNGDSTYYLAPFFEFREATGKAIKYIPGVGAMVTYTAARGDFDELAGLLPFTLKETRRLGHRIVSPRVKLRDKLEAWGILSAMLAFLVFLVRIRAAQRLWGWLIAGRGSIEENRNRKARELSGQIWREVGLLEGRWGVRRALSLLFALLFLGSATLACDSRPFRSDGTRASGRFAAGGADSIFYLHGDHLGAVNVVTNASGTEIERKDYVPFGEKDTSGSSGSSDSDAGFAATREEPAGLDRMGNRFYDPKVGRFTSADPVQFEPTPLTAIRMAETDFQGLSATPATNLKKRVEPWQKRAGTPQDLNRYTYVMNNPVSVVDVDGYTPVVTEGTLGWWKTWWAKRKNSVGKVIGAVAMVLAIAFTLGGAAAVGAFSSGIAGIISAWNKGGNLFAGGWVGAIVGAIAGGLGSLAPPGFDFLISGILIGAASGFAAGYAGGKGSGMDMLLGAAFGALGGLLTGGILQAFPGISEWARAHVPEALGKAFGSVFDYGIDSLGYLIPNSSGAQPFHLMIPTEGWIREAYEALRQAFVDVGEGIGRSLVSGEAQRAALPSIGVVGGVTYGAYKLAKGIDLLQFFTDTDATLSCGIRGCNFSYPF